MIHSWSVGGVAIFFFSTNEVALYYSVAQSEKMRQSNGAAGACTNGVYRRLPNNVEENAGACITEPSDVAAASERRIDELFPSEDVSFDDSPRWYADGRAASPLAE